MVPLSNWHSWKNYVHNGPNYDHVRTGEYGDKTYAYGWTYTRFLFQSSSWMVSKLAFFNISMELQVQLWHAPQLQQVQSTMQYPHHFYICAPNPSNLIKIQKQMQSWQWILCATLHKGVWWRYPANNSYWGMQSTYSITFYISRHYTSSSSIFHLCFLGNHCTTEETNGLWSPDDERQQGWIGQLPLRSEAGLGGVACFKKTNQYQTYDRCNRVAATPSVLKSLPLKLMLHPFELQALDKLSCAEGLIVSPWLSHSMLLCFKTYLYLSMHYQYKYFYLALLPCNRLLCCIELICYYLVDTSSTMNLPYLIYTRKLLC